MIILPSYLDTFSSLKDGTIKLVFHKNELTPQQLVGIATNLQKFGFLAFKEDAFKNTEKDVLNDHESDYDDNRKTQAQRLRNVLYVSYEQNNMGFKDFKSFYEHHTEKIINHYKSKLEQ